MKRVHELEVWSAPGLQMPPEFGKHLAREMWGMGFSKDVVLGLSFVPDHTDVQNLKVSFDDGELSRENFEAFCTAHHVAANPDLPDAAARFLEYSFGRKLAWLHVPEAEEAALLPRLQAAMKARGLVVVDPDAIACL